MAKGTQPPAPRTGIASPARAAFTNALAHACRLGPAREAPGEYHMATRMLIDARHPEETRVAVLKGNRIEEFDFESADRKQIKGNIYLAKVTRVEPSLQAAFVDFGGNRHGFLAFSEIHPDYYQIPKADRDALLAEEAAHAEEEAALRAAEDGEDNGDDLSDSDYDDDDDDESLDGGLTEVDTSDADEVSTIEAGHVENGDDEGNDEDAERDASSDEDGEGEEDEGQRRGRPRGRARRQGGGQRGRSKEADDLRARRMALRRRYKIQDVIHRRQVLLVQVVKEERGNKGAALTSYLSLAGRYCVLMPNSSHGGGISRKISSASDRKRLKSIISELNLPKSMGCIVRTAGLARTKTEIKRDFDYLARLWDELRETTLRSSAPTLIHSDSDLIKRAIRDIYNRDIEEVVVEGEDGYRAAKDFMKLLMPSHARRVKPYVDPVPLFQRYGAEDQLTAMYDPVVQLKSGGYIVINPTEALVSIDINSGRSTKEHGIEQTAVTTNLEAAREIARQLRLRDMAGLVVIDFIDMEYGSNVRKVEKAMKDALKNDRARIQVGRISSFGLMEMSRQRLRTGVLEATTRECPHCDGTGLVRTASSAGLSALRLIEDEAAKGRGSTVSLFASTEAAIYLLNAKRSDLADIEMRYAVNVEVIPEGENEGAKMRVLSSGPRPTSLPVFEPIVIEEDDDVADIEDDEDIRDEVEEDEGEGDEGSRRKRRRRRGGKGRRSERDEERTAEGSVETEAEADGAGEEDDDESELLTRDEVNEDGTPKKRRRRGGRRRRGRGRGGEADGQQEGDEQDSRSEPVEAEVMGEESAVQIEAAPEVDAEAPAKPKRTRRKKADAVAVDAVAAEEAPAEITADVAAEPVAEPVAEEAPAKPKRTRRKKADEPVAEAVAEAEPAATEPVEAAEEAPARPKRTRRKKADEPVAEAVAEVEPAVTEPAEAATAEEPEVRANDAEPAQDADASDQSPPRRGWWQRTFGE
jgi:ribonuclease E